MLHSPEASTPNQLATRRTVRGARIIVTLLWKPSTLALRISASAALIGRRRNSDTRDPTHGGRTQQHEDPR